MLGIAAAVVLGVTGEGRAPELFEDADNERPGATADTSAANPAVNAAAPAIIQRRVTLTRASAASRSSMARDRSASRCSGFECIMRREGTSAQ
jgi:hypothetical protein